MNETLKNLVLDAIEKYNSPFLNAFGKAITDLDKFYALLEDAKLFGWSEKISDEDVAKFEDQMSTIMATSTKLAAKLEIDPVYTLIALMFESGRVYEREQICISELEKMVK